MQFCSGIYALLLLHFKQNFSVLNMNKGEEVLIHWTCIWSLYC